MTDQEVTEDMVLWEDDDGGDEEGRLDLVGGDDLERDGLEDEGEIEKNWDCADCRVILNVSSCLFHARCGRFRSVSQSGILFPSRVVTVHLNRVTLMLSAEVVFSSPCRGKKSLHHPIVSPFGRHT